MASFGVHHLTQGGVDLSLLDGDVPGVGRIPVLQGGAIPQQARASRSSFERSREDLQGGPRLQVGPQCLPLFVETAVILLQGGQRLSIGVAAMGLQPGEQVVLLVSMVKGRGLFEVADHVVGGLLRTAVPTPGLQVVMQAQHQLGEVFDTPMALGQPLEGVILRRDLRARESVLRVQQNAHASVLKKR